MALAWAVCVGTALPFGSDVWGIIFTMGELSVEPINFPFTTSLSILTERAGKTTVFFQGEMMSLSSQSPLIEYLI